MNLICTQLRLSDTWFQVGFVAIFLCVINAAFFFWPDSRFWGNLLIVLAIDVFLLILVFSNIRVWKAPDNSVRLTYTIFGVIPWRSRFIRSECLLQVATRRITDDEAWSNCLTDLYWTEKSAKGMIVTKSTTILQRRQALGASVKEAKQVAKKLGVKFVDKTNKKSARKRDRYVMDHDIGA